MLLRTCALFISIFAITACSEEPSVPEPVGDASVVPEPLTIAVIPKGTTHVFWKAVQRGAESAGEDGAANIIWKGPLKENDRAQQIQVVQQFIAQGVDGIVLAPLDFKALAGPVAAARERGIPVVIFDSALDGEPGVDFVSFVATNNRTGGRLGGKTLTDLLQAGDDVAVLRYLAGSASTNNREEGALTTLRDAGFTILTENRYAGATAGEAKTTALNMIDTLRNAEGIFTPNESSTYGMLLALRQEGLASDRQFVGFDASPPLVDALRAGEIDALIVQDPVGMGRKAVQAMLDHLAGNDVERVIDTGVRVVTSENLDNPEIKRLIE